MKYSPNLTSSLGILSLAFLAVACIPGTPEPIPSPSNVSGGGAVCDPFASLGTGTVSATNGLIANLSYLPNGNENEYTGVMNFEAKATPVQAPVYLSQLYIPTQSFTRGFMTGNGTLLTDNTGKPLDQFFALHIESTIQLTPDEQPGTYQFAIASDDGSIMQIGNGSGGWTQLINNDGNHETELGCAQKSVNLQYGTGLPIQIDYFQGPPTNIALVLLWRKVASTCIWHSDGDGCSGGVDSPGTLNDPACGESGNDLFFDWSSYPSVPNQNWDNLLARGWSVVPAKNFFLPSSAGLNPCNTQSQCYTDTYTQPKQELAANSVDLLVMTNTSNGFSERSGIAHYLHSYANQLPQGVDLQVGMMLGDSSSSQYSGRLWHNHGLPATLDTNSLDISTMESEFYTDISQLPANDNASEGGQEGLFSMSSAVKAPNLAANQAAGFFRSKAALGVIFLSDQGDLCSTNPRANPSDCAGVTPTSVLAELDALKAGEPLSVNAIVQADHSICSGSDYGSGYIDIANLAKGLVFDLQQTCSGTAPYDQEMQQLGQAMSKLLSTGENTLPLQDDFKLTHTGVDPSTIIVQLNGSNTQFTYQSSSNQVDLQSPGTYGSVIAVNYCLLPAPSPSPSPSASPSPTATASPSPSPTVTAIPSPSPTVTPTPSPSPTVTPTPSPSPTVTPTPSPSPTVTSTPSPSPTVTPTPSPSPTVTPTPSPSPTVTPTPSPSPTVTPTPSPSPTVTPTPSPSPTMTPTPSPSPTVTPTPSPSPTVTPTPSPSPTVTPTPSPSPTVTPTPSPSPTVTPTPSPSPSPSPSTCSGPFCGGGPLGT